MNEEILLTHNTNADILVPDGKPLDPSLRRTTHLAIGAHQDDLEIMAYHGIASCYGEKELWFTGVTCTDGAGSSRVGPYARYSDLDMIQVRKDEQRQAAIVGQYGAMVQLCYPSSIIKDPESTLLTEDLARIVEHTRPRVVYAHNPADKHRTHIAVLHATIDALRGMDAADRPEKIYGCEVWRDLDWMPDEHKIALDVSNRQNLANALVGVFDSQITGGKRYDLAAQGRRYANATFHYAKEGDAQHQVTFAMDLSPLVADENLDVGAYVLAFIDAFRDDVRQNLDTWFRK